MADLKPHIRLYGDDDARYICWSTTKSMAGFGATAEEAYERWEYKNTHTPDEYLRWLMEKSGWPIG